MNRVAEWIAEGKVAQFVAGSLDAAEHALIFEVAKSDPSLREAINAAKEQRIHYGILAAKAQDAASFIASGMLEAYIDGSLADDQRPVVELMVAAHPIVGNAFYALKGKYVDAIFAHVGEIDPEELLASTRLMDYVLGEGSAAERLEIEMVASLFPKVQKTLNDLSYIDEVMVMAGAIRPPAASRKKFADFIEAAGTPADGWGLVMPMLTVTSSADDFKAWIDRIDNSNINPAENLNAIPLEVDRDVTTLFVVVKECLEEEVHLNIIERFLVLEGGCIVRMGDVDVPLVQGDYFSIPKFVGHTILVTSTIPCKLIVQQVAA
jgi:mannose-6-phosphate isomerase-like protein (cupin superfamily)